MTLNQAQEVLKSLSNGFSSHEFIEKYAFLYESDYIDMLYNSQAERKFQAVHAQIGRFLSEHSSKEELNIIKDGTIRSENVFGNPTEVQNWKKN